jgi:hypothetical protein
MEFVLALMKDNWFLFWPDTFRLKQGYAAPHPYQKS